MFPNTCSYSSKQIIGTFVANLKYMYETAACNELDLGLLGIIEQFVLTMELDIFDWIHLIIFSRLT